MRTWVVSLLAAVCLIWAPSAFGNVVGSVRGIVHDPQHRPIAGAIVQLHAASSSWAQSARTNADGEFAFPTVPVGAYLLTVSAPHFETTTERTEVTTNSSPILHFALALSSVTQTATVTAPAESTNPQSATPASLVSRTEITQTPGADRTNSLQMITDFVPGTYMTHDMLHVRGGHQVSWLIDGVPIPNTNIASNVGPQVDPKDIDYLEAERGGYSSVYGDRTYGVFNVVPRTGFERSNEGEFYSTYGSFNQTNDQVNFGSHTDKFAYFGSLNGNRSEYGLSTPGPDVLHDRVWGVGGMASLIYNVDPNNQLRFITTLRRDDYQIPNDPDAQAS